MFFNWVFDKSSVFHLGATLASVTVALDVAKKNDPNSILSRLRKIADSANTVTNRGLKDLVTAGTLTPDVFVFF